MRRVGEPKAGYPFVPEVDMELRDELRKIIENVGPENVWRPVYDDQGNRLSDGIADERDGRPEDVARVDFQGKSVVDLGCNFGAYSFLARTLGAGSVLGVDVDPQAVRGAQIIKNFRGIEGVAFLAADFTTHDFKETFDIGLLINFIGKCMVVEGINHYLDALAGLSRHQMVVSARPDYCLKKHLNHRAEAVRANYGDGFFKNNRFYLMNYIIDYFRPEWDVVLISPEDDFYSVKRTLLFTRKSSGV